MLHDKGGCYHSRMTLRYLRLWLGKERAFRDGFEEANKPAVKCRGEGQVSGSHSAPRPEGSQWEAKGLCHQTTRRKIWPTTWKNMKMDSPLMGPWVRAQTSWHLRHSLVRPWAEDSVKLCLDSWPMETGQKLDVGDNLLWSKRKLIHPCFWDFILWDLKPM